MGNDLPLFSPHADSVQLGQWAWRAGHTQCYSCLPHLRDLIGNRQYDESVREIALSSYWILGDVDNAAELQETLLSQNDFSLALRGVQHPRWWHDPSWLKACQRWLGRDPLVDEAIVRIWHWSNWLAKYVRVPREVLERAHVATRERTIDWEKMWRLGQSHLGAGTLPGFEGFWLGHIRQWSSRWLQWEEAIWRYYWRLKEEERLVEWTHKEDRGLRMPKLPEVVSVELPELQSAEDGLTRMALGLGYHVGAADSEIGCAAWDGIWSSWAASLNYQLYQILSNVRITEWHIAGPSGLLQHIPDW